MRFVDTEWSIYKGDGIAFEEVLFPVRGHIRVCRELSVAGHVDAMKGDFAVLRVAKGRTVNADAYGSHSEGCWHGLVLVCIILLVKVCI